MMSWLTPEERRGAVVLVVILLLGAGHDAWTARRMRADLQAMPLADSPGATDSRGVTDSAGSAPRTTAVSAEPRHDRLDLNRATLAELEDLPGIGPVLARRIVEARRQSGGFASLEELLTVRGVGPRLFERVRPLVVVRPPRAPMHSAASAPRRRADSASAKAAPSR